MIFKIIRTTNRFCLISIAAFCLFQNRTVFAKTEPIIKVLILNDKNIRIRSDKIIPLTIKGQRFSSKKIRGLTLKKQNNKTTLFFDKNKQKVYDLKNQEKFEVKSSDRRGIWVGQKRYAGKLNIYIRDNGILVVNVLGIENYLSSVVGSEMPAKWPLEALKAQAIASRTYALKQKGNPLFDVDSTNKNQVYIGLEARTYKTKKAVESTRSLVLTYKNKLINSLFHSSSAGMTENSQDVWKNKYPYLSSVRDFDKNNPKLRWNKKFSKSQLQKLFPKIGGIQQIEILNVTSTGRVKNVRIQGDYATDEISGVDIRKRMNLKSTLVRFKFIDDNETKSNNDSPKLLSTNALENKPLSHIVRVGDTLIVIADQYQVSVESIVALNKIQDSSLIKIGQRLLVPRNSLNSSSSSEKILIVSGFGSGHGVGMSQWGARYMADKGEKAKAILRHFYKGVEIKPFKKYFL